MKKSFFLKGDICWSSSMHSLETVENGYLLCLDGKSGGIFKEIPGQYAHLEVKEHSGKLIIPGLTDLHTHAPQFAFRGKGMDMELLEWLNKITFPEEAKYTDLEYAREAYGMFIRDLIKGPNTRICIFATIHVPATLLLMDMLEESGLVSLVGKVNMDRNCPENLREGVAPASSAKSPEKIISSVDATAEWLELFFTRRNEGRYKNTAAILTPRFIPCCSDVLMKSLAEIQKNYRLPVQSHLSENRKEVEWVRELCPKSESYAGAYAQAGLLGDTTIMAHCVWTEEKEMDLLAEKGVCIAHCPQSNTNLSSGIAAVRQFIEKGIHLGLGSDVAGGTQTSIFRAMSDAIRVSKLRQSIVAANDKALTLEEAFYMGTAGGGSFFGKLNPSPAAEGNTQFGPSGSFEKGWDFDTLIIDDSSITSPVRLKLRDRLERVVYLSDDRHIVGKYVRGKALQIPICR